MAKTFQTEDPQTSARWEPIIAYLQSDERGDEKLTKTTDVPQKRNQTEESPQSIIQKLFSAIDNNKYSDEEGVFEITYNLVTSFSGIDFSTIKDNKGLGLMHHAIIIGSLDIIKRLHYNCDTAIQKAYKMKLLDDDILMEWKFSIVSGIK